MSDPLESYHPMSFQELKALDHAGRPGDLPDEAATVFQYWSQTGSCATWQSSRIDPEPFQRYAGTSETNEPAIARRQP